ncbi:nucleoside 2-deoxyribosyltransferase [Vagococcus sp. DIV0080]|uniref:Nucleoside 2-deoxyribosyltransferase n=1 Tax=Candidatus Vagococcus giribetii TaxID=2230876 RepID=A0ABS3HQW9_9ENTE|nr:nucleoside 2-deoxyribosyltransferase [Vagococcus sp. DIV0080]MBO0476137.1 nucleoside 2-deoxyribosyltransferase [Vagococcus sp. DIV0080]
MQPTEVIYIAGPECFYEEGIQMLQSMRRFSEAKGHRVSLPNDDPLKMDHHDLRLNAHSIFQNLKKVMLETTTIIGDLDAFRGSEADSGTVYEMGMAYARNLKIYGYTRDKRGLVWKDQKIQQKEGDILDEWGNKHHYSFLPYSPLVVASTKIIEGNYEDCIASLEADELYGNNMPKNRKYVESISDNKTIYLAIRNRYSELTDIKLIETITQLKSKGYTVLLPYFREYDSKESIQEWLSDLLETNMSRINQAQLVIGDLNDYRGFECSNDVAFECGYAFQSGKTLYGYMEDTTPMIDRIPNTLIDGKYKDPAGRDVENFDYPINLMFACSMDIVEGQLEDIVNIL